MPMPHSAHTDSGEAVHNTGDAAPLRSHARVHPLTPPRTGTRPAHARARTQRGEGWLRGCRAHCPQSTSHGAYGRAGPQRPLPPRPPRTPFLSSNSPKLSSLGLGTWRALYNGSVAWGFSLVSHYPPGWGCHGPETKGQHAGNRTAKTFWGQRKDNSLFWERLM